MDQGEIRSPSPIQPVSTFVDTYPVVLSALRMASPGKSDIIISIRQPHLDHVVSLKKNHEFRKYLLPSSVKRFWIYEPNPVSAIKYIAEVSNGKRPGEIVDGGFIRNSDFNEGKIADGNFAYKILKLERLDTPITLSQLKAKGWLLGAPQKYSYVKEAMARDLRDMKTTAISAHSLPIWSEDNPEHERKESTLRATGGSFNLKNIFELAEIKIDIRSFLSDKPKSPGNRSATLSGRVRKERKK
ncbi:hypothetical protein BP6252_11134 [Coleophoma cylindrospora]|uniref:Uncharacterized protein n=1 Tax=Coleophoma cylindrospora TaxID=1849047 RepID=A0A3D8QP66_9HELO|nr:hypothetical protein BP6252_11134 [Coleophoma cylindrospora]